jgi:DNA-binding MarR family transcriptional regulator
MTARDEILALVKREPGLTMSEIARRISVTQQRTYLLIRQLSKDGLLRVEKKKIDGTALVVRVVFPAEMA